VESLPSSREAALSLLGRWSSSGDFRDDSSSSSVTNGQELLDVRSHDLVVLGETKGPLRVDGEGGVDVTEAGMQARTQAQRAVRT
jgi:hypothetical protein